jgi:hypothetical protein
MNDKCKVFGCTCSLNPSVIGLSSHSPSGHMKLQYQSNSVIPARSSSPNTIYWATVGKKMSLIALMTILGCSIASSDIITYTSTPQYGPDTEPSGATNSVPFSSISTELVYKTTATYGALVNGTMLRFHLSDSYHVYGPYSSSDSWGTPQSLDGYAGLTLSGETSGGSVEISSLAQVTAVDYEELVYTLSGYEINISYGALASGAELRIFTADAYHVYGPFGVDNWSSPTDHGTYSALILGQDTSGGSVQISTLTPVSSVIAVPEPSMVALLGMGSLVMVFSRNYARRNRFAGRLGRTLSDEK